MGRTSRVGMAIGWGLVDPPLPPLREAGSCSGLARSSSFHLLLPLLNSAGRVSPRRARHFSLLRQRKVPKRKATRSLGPLRFAAGQPAVLEPSGVRLNSPSAQTTPALIRLSLRSSAQPGRGNRDREPNTKDKEDKYKQGHAMACPCGFRYLAVRYSFSHPLCMRRGAEVQADQGSRCLSGVKRSEFSETPPEPSTAGCPQRSGGTQQPGSPFLLLTFLLAKQKKSE